MLKKIVFIFSFIFFLFIFVGCTDTEAIITNIELINLPEQIEIGKFNECNIKYKIEYSDGEYKEEDVKEKDIPEEYQHFLYEEGTHEFSFLYRGFEVEFKVTMYELEYTVTFLNLFDEVVKTYKTKGNEEIIYPTDEQMHIEGYRFLATFDKNITNTDITIKGNYVKVWTVKFFNGLNELISTQIVDNEQNAIEPTYEEKRMDGYKFIMWDKTFNNVTEDVNVYGMYEKKEQDIKEYSVIFKDYDGTVLKSENVEEGDSATPPTNPSKEHYDFISWDKEYTNIQSDLEIFALYKPTVYTITFDSNGGYDVNDIEFTIESKNFDLPTPTRDGYDFIGWYENNELFTNLQYQNYNFVAKWEENNERLEPEVYEENGKLYVNFGKYPQTVVTDETIINALSTLTSTNSSGYIEYNCKEYKKVVANPRESNYTFINGNTITKGDIYYFEVLPIKWRILEENDGTYKLLSEMILDNTNFYHTYNQTRTISGKTIYSNNYEYSNIRAWLNGYDGTSYNVDNYTGIGFYDIAFTKKEQSLINTQLVNNDLSSTGDAENKYICNNTNDKVYLLSRTEVLNTSYGFSKDYYDFDIQRRAQVSDYARSKECYMYNSTNYYGNGYWWLCSPTNYSSNISRVVDDSGNVYNFISGYSNYGVRAALTISFQQSKKYQISFKDYDGTVLKTEIVKEGKNATASNNPEREGYDFIGWDKEYTNIQSDLEIYALYKPNVYTITFNSNGSTDVFENIDIEYDQKFDITTYVPKKHGYTFEGWYNGEIKVTNGTWNKPTNVELIAKWEATKYNIIYDLDGGIATNPTTYTIEDEITLNNPTKRGYTFVAWITEEWEFELNLSLKNETGDKYYTAYFSINTYNLTFEEYIGTSINPRKYTVEDEIVLNNPTKTGYTFIGWTSEDIEEPQLNVVIKNETGNKHFVANFKKSTYKITLNVNGGDPLENEEIEIEYQSIFDTTPTRDGYDFIGWYTEDGELVKLGYWYETNDLTLKAKWIDEKYNYTVENNVAYIEFGRYPQTVVTDESIIKELSNINKTNSFGYIEYNGKEYKKSVANPYSNLWTSVNGYMTKIDVPFINGDPIKKDNIYYYEVLPIKWRVLQEKDGTYKLLTQMIIDSTEFCNAFIPSRTIDGKKIYNNNYEYSNIRAWLNGYDGTSYYVDDYTGIGFYDIAFTEEEQALINTTLVDNSLESTIDAKSIYICNNTNDKVYLLSRKETLNEDYGFSIYQVGQDRDREALLSDYARSKGCWVYPSKPRQGNGSWMLRSPKQEEMDVFAVDSFGCTNTEAQVYGTNGVRPALTITIN